LSELEKVKVGALPNASMNLLDCLVFIDDKVARQDLPKACRLKLEMRPNTLAKRHSLRSITTPGMLESMDLLEPLNIKPGEDLQEQLASLNLRQFLWLVVRAYLLEVMYTEFGIVVNDGVQAHQFISPD
jgi:hypothetical protein